jgi:hypothetical protein
MPNFIEIFSMALETEMLPGRHEAYFILVFGALSAKSSQKFVNVLKLNPSTATEHHLISKINET